MSGQVEFFFSGNPLSADSGAGGARTDYAGFNLNGVEYKLGDCAFLYPEDEGVPPYVGRILKCFHDRSGSAADPHCVEVAWYERRAHLEPDPVGGNWEREVVALEETDVNPIGCISGKAVVLKTGDYDEASRMAEGMAAEDWLFCRGFYKQNCVIAFPELAEHIEASEGKRHGKRSQAGASSHAEGVADSDEFKRQRIAEEQPAAPVRRTGKLVSGRTCVECGATQTPQWREGPAGPKTLCNACGVRYVRAQQRANKRAVAVGAPRSGYGSGGRQSRNYKAAKAEAASVRAARAAAASAAFVEEASQRLPRQAALMAASKTAQYARTGVFPVCATDLEPPLDMVGGQTGVQQQQPLLQQDVEDAMGGAAGAPCAPAAGAMPGPGTPNCSSYDSCGILEEGVTVEVVVGPADGDAECCGGDGEATAAGAAAATAAAAAAAAAAVTVYPLLEPSVASLLPPLQFGGCSGVMIPADQSVLTVAPLLALGSGPLSGSVPQLPALDSVLGVSTGLMSAAGNHGSGIFFASAPDCHFGGEGGCFTSDQVCPQPAALRGAPALSGGRCDMAMADSGSCVLSAAAVESSVAPQVISAPVSPSARGGGGFGCCDFGGDVGLEDDLQLHGYGNQVGCGLDDGLDDEYAPLVEVEVDFGLGPASVLGDGSLFGEFHREASLGCEDDDHPFQQPQPQTQHQQDDEEGVFSAGDLPGVAARVAAFCPELAPGTDAREVLDSAPVLARTCLVPTDDGAVAGRGDVAVILAAPAMAAGGRVVGTAGLGGSALPGEAVAQLVVLGRQASRAATEAMAADAAFLAVSQVLESHQDAARKARDAAVVNLDRLKDCITTLTGGDALAAADVSGQLIDLHDLGNSGGLASMASGCCCPFDTADLGVTVHS